MKNFQITLPQQLVNAVNCGSRDAFGITRREGDHQLFLVTQHRWLPIAYMRLRLTVGGNDPVLVATEHDFSWRMALLYDRDAQNVRASVFDEGVTPNTLVSTDTDAINGYVLALAAQRSDKDYQTPFAMCAVFANGQGAVLADSTPELVRHWTIMAQLLERGAMSEL